MTTNTAILERNAQRFYGCSYAEALSINDGQPFRKLRTPVCLYLYQRQAAKKRGIGWEITLPEWIEIWYSSGYWDLRGVGIGKFCMSRHGDLGPYRVGNVAIKTNVENSREGIERARPAMRLNAHRLGGSGATLGSGRGWTLKKLGVRRFQVVAGQRYVGCFATQEEAESAYRSEVDRVRHESLSFR